jgi:hypothetical protein
MSTQHSLTAHRTQHPHIRTYTRISPIPIRNTPSRSEFKKFLKYLLFFEELYEEFMMIDKDHDNRLSLAEFVEGASPHHPRPHSLFPIPFSATLMWGFRRAHIYSTSTI